MGFFSKIFNKEVLDLFKKNKKNELNKKEILDYENFKKTGELLNEEQKDYLYELDPDDRVQFGIELLKQFPNRKIIEEFGWRICYDSIKKNGYDTNKNDFLYFITHLNIKNEDLIDYKVAETFIQAINNGNMDVRNKVWYNESLYVDDRLNHRIKLMVLVLNPDLQRSGLNSNNITTIEDVMDENNVIISTAAIERTIDKKNGVI